MKKSLVAIVAILSIAMCCKANVSTTCTGELGNSNNSKSLAIVLRGTNYYVSGDDKIVLYSNGTFQLRSGSAVLYTGSYDIIAQGKEIKFTIKDQTFYGSFEGQAAQPHSITFSFDGKRYTMYRRNQ